MERLGLKRALTEAAVVVASILLAFAIDAWWQERSGKVQEATTLTALAEDFAGYSSQIELSRQNYQRRLEAAAAVLEAVGPEATMEPGLVEDLGVVGFLNTQRFQGGALSTLVNTSGLSSLHDPQLRLALTGWLQALEFLAEVNQFALNEATELGQLIKGSFPLQDLDRAAGVEGLGPSNFEGDLTPLLRDIRFANSIYQQHYATRVLLGQMDQMDAIAAQVLGLVR